jgi:hypothetical protein
LNELGHDILPVAVTTGWLNEKQTFVHVDVDEKVTVDILVDGKKLTNVLSVKNRRDMCLLQAGNDQHQPNDMIVIGCKKEQQ